MAENERELIAPNGDQRYIRRDDQGRIEESTDVGRSLTRDRATEAKHTSQPGHGDRGDRTPAG